MIINISGSHSPFPVTRIEFDRNQKYLIRLVSLHTVIASFTPSGIYKICTNLIERENGNSDRVIAYIHLNKSQNVIAYVPPQSVWYKLRLHDISSADIKLESVITDTKLIFKEFACRFEVIENARIQ